MKRALGEPTTPVTLVPSLLDLLLTRIVSTFERQEALDYYLALVSHPNVREQLRQRWELKNSSPSHTLVCVKRRLVSADVTIRYLDTRELINNGGIIAQTTRSHTTPVAVNAEASIAFTDLMLGKLQVDLQRSTTHRKPFFILH